MKQLIIQMVLYIQRCLILILVLASIAYFFIASTLGLQVLAHTFIYLVPGKIILEDLQGTLLTGISVKHFKYELSRTFISGDNVVLSWDANKLRDGILFVNSLSAHDLQINLQTDSTQNTTSTVPTLPDWVRRLKINKIDLNNIDVTNNQKALITIKHLNLLGVNNYTGYKLLLETNKGNLWGGVKLSLLPTIHWSAELTAKNVNLDAISPNYTSAFNFVFTSSGQWGEKNRSLSMAIPSLNGTIRNYALRGKVDFNYLNGRVEIKSSQLTFADSIIEVKGKIQDRYDLAWRIKIPSLQKLLPTVKGTMASSGTIVGPTQSPAINMTANVNNLLISSQKVKIQRLFASLHAFKLPTQTAINIELKQLDFSNAELETVQAINGRIKSMIKLAGSFQKPLIVANAQLLNGSAKISEYGIKLNNINLQTTYQTNQPIRMVGAFKSGNGNGSIKGSVDLNSANYTLLRGHFNLDGQRLQLMNLPGYKINGSPSITLDLSPQMMRLNGKLILDDSAVTLGTSSDVINLSPDVVYVGRKQVKVDVPTSFYTHLAIALGKNIYFEYQNLKTNLAGQVIIDSRPGSLPTGSGYLATVNGTYKAYGKLLAIQDGRIIYTGNALTNPGLDIRASQKFKTIELSSTSQFTNDKQLSPVYAGSNSLTAGVQVKGSLNNPIVSLYSDPPINQDDILSYLVFGYPRSQISGASSLALLNSFSSNVNSSGKSIGEAKDNVQKALGLSELDIGSTEYFDPQKNAVNNTTAVSVGKKLGEHLFIHYSISIFDSVQILNLKYQINKFLALQSETSTLENGADVLYEYERN